MLHNLFGGGVPARSQSGLPEKPSLPSSGEVHPRDRDLPSFESVFSSDAMTQQSKGQSLSVASASRETETLASPEDKSSDTSAAGEEGEEPLTSVSPETAGAPDEKERVAARSGAASALASGESRVGDSADTKGASHQETTGGSDTGDNAEAATSIPPDTTVEALPASGQIAHHEMKQDMGNTTTRPGLRVDEDMRNATSDLSARSLAAQPSDDANRKAWTETSPPHSRVPSMANPNAAALAPERIEGGSVHAGATSGRSPDFPETETIRSAGQQGISPAQATLGWPASAQASLATSGLLISSLDMRDLPDGPRTDRPDAARHAPLWAVQQDARHAAPMFDAAAAPGNGFKGDLTPRSPGLPFGSLPEATNGHAGQPQTSPAAILSQGTEGSDHAQLRAITAHADKTASTALRASGQDAPERTITPPPDTVRALQNTGGFTGQIATQTALAPMQWTSAIFKDSSHHFDLEALQPVSLHAATGLSETSAPLRQTAAAPLGHPDFPRQVVHQLASAVRSGPDQTADILLNPAELGRVRINLQSGDMGITVNILADRPETLELLRRNVELLAQDFREIGYGAADFAFGQGGDPRSNPEHHQDQGAAPANTSSVSGAERPAQAEERPLAAQPLDRIDIRL